MDRDYVSHRTVRFSEFEAAQKNAALIGNLLYYLFLAAAFFSFHLLLAYLVDHLAIHALFLISSAVSLFLVVTYLRRAARLRSTVREAALAQLVYLVLFSYAFFFEGYTGLTVTIGAVLTLFVLMQITARVDWGEVFARPAPPRPGPAV